MRSYIFTEQERRILEAWLNQGTKHRDLRVLKHLILERAPRIDEDYSLLQKALKGFGQGS